MKHEQTIVEKITQVLGDQTLTAGEIVAALEKGAVLSGVPFQSKNLPGYVSSVLVSAEDAEGQRCFEAVSRGKYRALTKTERRAQKKASQKEDREAVQWLSRLSEKDSDHYYRLVAMGEGKISTILDRMEGRRRSA